MILLGVSDRAMMPLVVVELLRLIAAARVVVIGIAVVIVVHFLSALLGMVMGALAVDEVLP